MVCNVCGTKLILDNREKIICPKCSGLNFLPKKEALDIAKKQADWLRDAFVQVLNKFEKKRLLVWLLGEREKISSAFFNTPKVVINDFLSMNVLIKWVPLYHKGEDRGLVNEKIAEELIDAFSGFIKVVDRHNLILDDFGHIIAKQNLNYDKLDCNTLMSNYIFVMNEDWFPIMKTFEEHLILSEKKADEQTIQVGKEKLWNWNSIDTETKYLIANNITKSRYYDDAVKIVQKAKD